MTSNSEKRGTHLDRRVLTDHYLSGAPFTPDQEAHLAACAECERLANLLLLSLPWAEESDPQHAAHADEIDEAVLEALLLQQLDKPRADRISERIGTCGVCRGRLEVLRHELAEWGLQPGEHGVEFDLSSSRGQLSHRQRGEIVDASAGVDRAPPVGARGALPRKGDAPARGPEGARDSVPPDMRRRSRRIWIRAASVGAVALAVALVFVRYGMSPPEAPEVGESLRFKSTAIGSLDLRIVVERVDPQGKVSLEMVAPGVRLTRADRLQFHIPAGDGAPRSILELWPDQSWHVLLQEPCPYAGEAKRDAIVWPQIDGSPAFHLPDGPRGRYRYLVIQGQCPPDHTRPTLEGLVEAAMEDAPDPLDDGPQSTVFDVYLE